MEKALQCPKCGSTEIEARDHDKLLRTTGGVLLTAAGTTAALWVVQQLAVLLEQLLVPVAVR